MREKPILFSGAMVRALLAGTKTQTRRAMAVQPISEPHVARVYRDKSCTKPVIAAMFDDPAADGSTVCLCPYGVPSDRLWVREAFIHEPADYCWEASVSIPSRPAITLYRADVQGDSAGAGWKPSIHMPRSLSRITLELTDVRVERLQEISEADAKAEGIGPHRKGGWWWEQPPEGIAGTNHFGARTALDAYSALFESINGAGSWDVNPWVWVLAFRRVAPPTFTSDETT